MEMPDLVAYFKQRYEQALQDNPPELPGVASAQDLAAQQMAAAGPFLQFMQQELERNLVVGTFYPMRGVGLVMQDGTRVLCAQQDTPTPIGSMFGGDVQLTPDLGARRLPSSGAFPLTGRQ